ncbi:uncharacterized protein NEMAJ01_1808 [Nematocida major]|uniref:uncharacterized protein n=1 Tax=Nematocida major TaxID=1912982 RepID=UPI0020087C4A|nr:uncharacterized protein NEMAJ01_1808 [Nematocida major]KAH9386912.1 hypothetical protein NEMAJ01_1808 [Nematocida major]
MNIILVVFCVGLAALVRADNYHTEGRKKIICNGTELNIPCVGTRWKISYLGTDSRVNIVEDAEAVHISNAVATGNQPVYKDGRVVYPSGYRIVLDQDVLYGKVPEKIILMTTGILFTILATLPVYAEILKYF